ncbi:hypothetical protein TBLA_0A09400 [Henningerozyma blattae CBS 6284]|uniref:20S-pre-rRNA D-site endonuclease NOB1 n=1 Tax=Henningerozyma blattae (strain ATCC 34711 / CBS 6284 / DSM 70876 / NBRC 10599 / NRRL Y-10934 / UCD 77-7) TaxID=1071380 RepID=I2GX73_HENB6|nr:hypothetical protein TBLA_0A09400 [Tetrapisispora blattae CBS 6284]CCH58725.1 hypothetical protein TBLA_0A09400 [Tetrapisispora blattae CBS 6284]
MTETIENRDSNEVKNVEALVLDATPLITQSYSKYQNFAKKFFTTPGVFNEIRDPQSLKNLELWKELGNIIIRQPTSKSVDVIKHFSRLTGDSVVLSKNDIDILALAYELEVEYNNGDWRLRKIPGDILKTKDAKTTKDDKSTNTPSSDEIKEEKSSEIKEEKTEEDATDGFEQTKSKHHGRNGRKQRTNEETPTKATKDTIEASIPETKIDNNETTEVKEVTEDSTKEEEEEEQEGEDDGDWITPDNLTQVMIKDSGLDSSIVQDKSKKDIQKEISKVALATGDFAIQNVAIQMNLNLMNFMSGMRIEKIRNYRLRCHACFKMFPVPKDNRAKDFCPSCGGEHTLIRCAVSINRKTGEIIPHLKSNFQWKTRGNRYSAPSPLSKNEIKRYGKKGYNHSKPQNQGNLYREDDRQYEKTVKQEDWVKKHNEKILDQWIGGGSVDNYISPFGISGLKQANHARVGRGRHANSNKKKR